jgi:hypothetical protein
VAPVHTSCSRGRAPAWPECGRYSRSVSVGMLLTLKRMRRSLRTNCFVVITNPPRNSAGVAAVGHGPPESSRFMRPRLGGASSVTSGRVPLIPCANSTRSSQSPVLASRRLIQRAWRSGLESFRPSSMASKEPACERSNSVRSFCTSQSAGATRASLPRAFSLAGAGSGAGSGSGDGGLRICGLRALGSRSKSR